MPFDSVVSIGRQSLLDGVWRILQPALQSLSNPLPISLPGMTNAWVRIRKITPTLSTGSPSGLGLGLAVDVEVLGDILLAASVKSDTITLALPDANIEISKPTKLPNINLPTGDITISLPNMTGIVPIPTATGQLRLAPASPLIPPPPAPPPTFSDDKAHMTLPTGSSLDFPKLDGTLKFLTRNPRGIGLMLPSAVPLALNLTPAGPARIPVTVSLATAAIDPDSAFGLLLTLGTPTVGAITNLPPSAIYGTAITSALSRLLPQLGVNLPAPSPTGEPFVGVGPTLAQIGTIASAIAAAAPAAIGAVITAALAGLTARTGRLVFPLPAAGLPCDVALLPTEARAQVGLSAKESILQVGFLRTGVSPAPFSFPSFTPSAAAEVEVRIENRFLLDLLCCLVEKLPNFTFLSPAAPSGAPPRICCNWQRVRLELGSLVLTGFLEVCIVGSAGVSKTIELNGSFVQVNSLFKEIGVKFSLTMNIELNNVAALTGLRLLSASVTPNVDLQPGVWVLLAGIAIGLSLPLNPFLAPAMLALFIGVPLLLLSFLREQLTVQVETLLNRVHALESPVAVPPGLFEAFGSLVPESITIDDLIATGVLATPTAPWALLPLGVLKFPTTLPPPHPTTPVD